MRELENNWEYFMTENETLESMRPIVYQSWKRCQRYEVDPLQEKAKLIMDENKFMELISRSNLYQVSQPVIEDLFNQIKGTQHLITLSDNKGRIIHLKGDYKIESQAQQMNFVRGADWSEKSAGSNAIGTSLAVGQPVQILSHEHYCEGVHPWACSAAPIRDPLTRKILGVIDLTGPSETAQPHSLTVVQSVSSLIEQRLLQSSYKVLEHLHYKYEQVKNKPSAVHVIVLDERLHVVQADAECLSLLRLNHWGELWNSDELKQLKKSLLENERLEYEWDIPSLKLKVFIKSILLNTERVGFVFCFEKMYQFHPSDANRETVLKGVIGNSTVMNNIIKKAQVISDANVPVLLTGESGTGKEVFAYAIHQKSPRKNEPFIAINCGAIPDNLISSELFGYEPGAFTGGNPKGKVGKFEEANNGTILLDEIGEMPLDLQVHLLRVLQEKEIVRIGSSKSIPINVRIIAATNKDLTNLIEEGLFRSDLYFRLNVVELHLPPLRKRDGDIQLLCHFFMKELAHTHEKPVPTMDDEVLQLFQQYHWPGNIRELMNVMEYAVLFSDENHISVSSLPKSLVNKVKQPKKTNNDLSPLEQKEKEKLMQLMAETNGNLSEVARRCKIARTTLYRKIEKYNLGSVSN